MKPDLIDRLDAIRDRLHRWRWRIRLVLAVILLPWFAHYTYTRWMGRPPNTVDTIGGLFETADAGLLRPPKEADRTLDLAAALKRLPPLPALLAPTSAPAGMRWVYRSYSSMAAPAGGATIAMVDAMGGEWTPATRHHLSQIVRYIESPATAKALDDVVALSEAPFCLDSNSGLGLAPESSLSTVAKLLVARARYWLAEHNDSDRAVRDIRAAIQLAEGWEDDGTVWRCLRSIFIRWHALREIGYWTRENALEPRHCRDLLTWLNAHPFYIQRAWEAAIRGERAHDAYWLDHTYTTNASGDSWIVFIAHDPPRLVDKILPSRNLLSIFFDDRESVQKRREHRWNTLMSLRHQPYHSAAQVLNTSPERLRRPTDFYGSMQTPVRWYARLWKHLADTEALFAGTTTSLALAAYRADHGRYPEGLAALVPEYLSDIPMDPFSDAPLRYKLDEEGAYTLYSVGSNGDDDGGIAQRDENASDDQAERLDLILNEPRFDRYEMEWFLVPNDGAPATEDGNVNK